jgi:hypothetical protein
MMIDLTRNDPYSRGNVRERRDVTAVVIEKEKCRCKNKQV